MAKAGVDMVWRDFCAHLLIPLNECRRKTWCVAGGGTGAAPAQDCSARKQHHSSYAAADMPGITVLYLWRLCPAAGCLPELPPPESPKSYTGRYAPWKCEHERHEYEKCQVIVGWRGAMATWPGMHKWDTRVARHHAQ